MIIKSKLNKPLISLLSLVVATALLLTYVFVPTHVRLGKEILNLPINDSYVLLGYKAMSTEPKDGKLNHYYLVSKDLGIADAEPFLISSDPFIRLIDVKENKIKIAVVGRVKHFDNDLWVSKPDEKVEHWFISADIDYTR